MNKKIPIFILLTLSFIFLLYTISSFADELSLTTVFTPRCKGDNTSDWKTNDWCKDYYDISNLCPGEYGDSESNRKGCDKVVKDVEFGRWQKGTYEGYTEFTLVKNYCWDCDYRENPAPECTATASCPVGYTIIKCYVRATTWGIDKGIYDGACESSKLGSSSYLVTNKNFSEISPTEGGCSYTAVSRRTDYAYRSVIAEILAICGR